MSGVLYWNKRSLMSQSRTISAYIEFTFSVPVLLTDRDNPNFDYEVTLEQIRAALYKKISDNIADGILCFIDVTNLNIATRLHQNDNFNHYVTITITYRLL